MIIGDTGSKFKFNFEEIKAFAHYTSLGIILIISRKTG